MKLGKGKTKHLSAGAYSRKCDEAQKRIRYYLHSMATTTRKLFAGKKSRSIFEGKGGLSHNWLTGYIYAADIEIGSATIKTGCYIQSETNKTFGRAYCFYEDPNKGQVTYFVRNWTRQQNLQAWLKQWIMYVT